MRNLVRHLDGPLGRLRLAALPRLRADHAGAVGLNVHAGLERHPLVRLPLERHGHLQPLLVRVHFDFLRVAPEDDKVALIDLADLGHLARLALAHHVRLHGVVFQARLAHEDRRALEELVVNRLDQRLRVARLAHLELEARANPRQRRIREQDAFLGLVLLVYHELFEVLLDGQARQHAPTDVALQAVGARAFKRARAGHHVQPGDELAVRVERALHARAHAGRRRDVADPLQRLRVNVLLHDKAIRVERADAEGRRLAGLQQYFARDDLELRGLAGRGPVLSGGFRRQAGVIPRLAEAIELLRGLHIHLAVVNCRRAEAAAFERHMAENLPFLVARLDDVKRAGRARIAFARTFARGVVEHRHVELAVGVDEAGVALLDAQPHAPKNLPVVHVHAAEVALLRDDIHAVTDENRMARRGGNLRRVPQLNRLSLDEHRRVRRVGRLHLRNLHADHLARFVGRAEDGDDLVVVVNNGGRVDAGLEQRHAPDGLARAGIRAEHVAVAGRGDEHALALEPRQHRMGERVILGALAGPARPDEFAALFVEGIHAVARRALIAPVRGDAAHDDEVAVNQRRRRARVRERQPPELLHHRVAPQLLAVRRERVEHPLRAERVNVARLRVHRRAARRVAQVNRV